MGEEITTYTIDLMNDISELINKFSNIKEIYLFGSRAYRTNSTRSDIDLIVFSDELIPPASINEFHKEHLYLDIFVGNNIAITSSINGSLITKRGDKDLVEQLDAVLLWSSEKGFENKEYCCQTIFSGQNFFGSLHPFDDGFLEFKRKINRPMLGNECLFFFQESMVDFVNKCYFSCMSMIGLACECIVDKLVETCSNKYLSETSGNFIQDYCHNRESAKTKIHGLDDYFKAEKSFFDGLNFKELDEKMSMFNIIRKYRNNADHPLGYKFDRKDCDRVY